MSRPGHLVDPVRLGEWLDRVGADRLLPGSGLVQVQPLGEGHSNLTFLVSRGGDALVLRRPPSGTLLPTAHDVVREYRVLDLLARSAAGVRVPSVVAVCEDATVLGAPFYVMRRVRGTVVRDRLPLRITRDPAAARVLGLDVADCLAEIHLVDWRPFVAAGIGRPGGYLVRQLRRWTGQRDRVRQAVAAAGGRARELPDYDAVRDWLLAHLPEEGPPALVHGDFKLDNVIIGRSRRRPVRAVLDWEMATVGDPRADLGYLVSFWPEAGEDAQLPGRFDAVPGLSTRADLVHQWAAGTDRQPTDLRWFMTLAQWKLAVLLEDSYHRWLAGTATDPFFGTLADGVPRLLARARGTCGA